VSHIGWCPAERLGDLQAFIDEHWKPGHVLARDAELLRWQHPRPDGDLSVLVAHDDAGALRGMLGIVPTSCGFRGVRRDGAWLTTWAVVPEARAEQLGLMLLRHVLDEATGLVGTLGGNDTTMRILGALRFHTISAVPRWILPGDREALRGLLDAADATEPDWPAPRPPSPPAGVEIGDWEPEAWDAAWHERIAPGVVGTWRDAAYVRWRYLEHPRFAYEVRLARRGGAVTGLLVLRRQRLHDRPEDVVRVVELLGDEPAMAALAAHVAGETLGPGTAFADFSCTSRRVAAPLEDAGFLAEDPHGPTLPSLLQPLDARRTRLTGAFWAPEGAGPFMSDDAYFTRSDCDQDRPN
jgi:hypothetical protein